MFMFMSTVLGRKDEEERVGGKLLVVAAPTNPFTATKHSREAGLRYRGVTEVVAVR